MGRWDSISDVDASGDKKPWFEPGKYQVRILRFIAREARSGQTFFIIESELLKIFSTIAVDKMVVGKVYSQAIKWNGDMGPINVKRFMLAANSLDPNDAENNAAVSGDDIELAISDEQPLAGIEMTLQCDLIKTGKGNDFTKHTWFEAEG
jgi:hypothetical protein